MRTDVHHWEIVIALAIAISYETFALALNGGISISAAIVRFVTAGVLTWAGVALIERLWDAYSRAARQRQFEDYLRQRAELARETNQRAPGYAAKMNEPNK